MASVFAPSANTTLRVGILAAAALGASVIAGPMIWVRTPWARDQFDPSDQPVEFDHRHHARDDGIDCLYCHTTATRAATAGIPPTETCVGCHNQIWSQSPMLEVVRRSWFSGAPIPWQRVHQVPGFTYFNHSIHTSNGFGCSTCHGRVDHMPAVYQVNTLTMGWCLECHRNPERYIRPKDQITNMEWDAGERQIELGQALVREYGIRKLTHCSTCHR